MIDYRKEIENYIQQEKDVLTRLDIAAVNEVMNALEDARMRSANIFICGNGGSAATSSHFACDFNKGISEEQPHICKYRFVCLNDNIPTMLAIANDISYNEIFSIQLEGRINEGDLLIAVSGSGNSPNIIKAIQSAKKAGAHVIGMTGYDGGEVGRLSDYHLHVPVDNMQIAEDIHMIFEHMMMSILKS